MATSSPPIERYMSSVLVTVRSSETIADASRHMRLHGIRHLPVLDGEKLVGILSERDVGLIESLRDLDPTQVLVEDAMTEDPYQVDPEEPIARVVTEMAERRIGSAVVAHDGKLLGLFTTTDALRALAAHLALEREMVSG
jgi:acetoin utilization protein AcuB